MDARIYRHSKEQGRQPDPLHALTRDSPGYRAAVEPGMAVGRSAARFTVLTGGGPGAMEAVPLGVRLTGAAASTVDSVLDVLAEAPAFGGDAEGIGRWLAAALRVDPPEAGAVPRTIGIPTWFYGHEPPNPFCARHAKYFANSVRARPRPWCSSARTSGPSSCSKRMPLTI